VQCAVEDAPPPFCVRLLKHVDGWPESKLTVLMNGDTNVDVVTTNVTAMLRRNVIFEILARWLPNTRLTSVSVNWTSSLLSPLWWLSSSHFISLCLRD
jgi:hypothetical protein